MNIALAHSHSAPAFNGLFYATAATIIPVLFLAIAVQGRMYDKVLTAPKELNLWLTKHLRDREGETIIPGFVVSLAALFVAVTILIFGIEGEIDAITSLYLQRSFGPSGEVDTAAVGLTVIAGAVPVAAFLRYALSAVGEIGREVWLGPPSADNAQAPGAPQRAAPPHRGTDPEGDGHASI